MVLDDTWVSGRFDRVIVERDARGRAVRATVFDFKTDLVGSEPDLTKAAARHAVQMDLYRRVVARLAGLAESAVTGEVVFTRVGRRVAVPADRQKF